MTSRMSCSTRMMVTPRSRMRVMTLVELLGLARVHAGRRLVEQQEPRPRGERARQFELALFAIGQIGGLGIALVGEAEEFEQLDAHWPASARSCVRLAERTLQHGAARAPATPRGRRGSARRS